jgi:CRP-like cAMP-binding protein
VIEARLTAQLEAAMLRTAIMSLPRAEHRILALMWQLADRWGVVTVEGVAVRLELTHELLGRLTGARRPTVSLALHLLEEQRALSRAAPGVWLLAHDSCEMIERPSRPAPVVPIGN